MAAAGARLISGGTDNHLALVDVTPLGVTGREAEALLDDVGITVNKNAIPFDEQPPNIASGIRIGTPATTTRGMGTAEMERIGQWIVDALRDRDDAATHDRIRREVRELVDGSRARPPARRRLTGRCASPRRSARSSHSSSSPSRRRRCCPSS